MLTLNLIAYLQVSWKVREFNCEASQVQGMANVVDFLGDFSQLESIDEETSRQIQDSAQIVANNIEHIPLANCDELELTYMEVQMDKVIKFVVEMYQEE